MSGRFEISFPGRRDHDDPWFRIGTVDVTTALLVAGLCGISMFVWALSPSLLEPLVLWPDKVRHGQVWRLVTWPLANEPDVWTVLTIAMLWYFGRELERIVGRVHFAWMLGLLAVVPGLVGTLVDIPSAGIRPVEIAVFVLFAAEHPDIRFFGGIPAWVFAAVIVGVEMLQLTGLRQSERILLLLVSLATAALAGKSYGLLERYEWIPRIPLPKRRTRRAIGGSGGATVVAGPWSGTPTHTAADQIELDGLLDKISARGIESLSRHEKARLNELSKKLRGR